MCFCPQPQSRRDDKRKKTELGQSFLMAGLLASDKVSDKISLFYKRKQYDFSVAVFQFFDDFLLQYYLIPS